MRPLIVCALLLQTTMTSSSPVPAPVPAVYVRGETASAQPVNVDGRAPTAEDVRAALETLKRTGVDVQIVEPRSPFHNTALAAKITAGSVAVTFGTLLLGFSRSEKAKSTATRYDVLGGCKCPVTKFGIGAMKPSTIDWTSWVLKST